MSKNKFLYELDRIKMKMNLISNVDAHSINKTFIISTGRTGTKFFAKFFNQVYDFKALHEPNPDFIKYSIEFAKKDIKIKEAEDHIKNYRKAIFRDLKRRNIHNYIESNNRLFSLIKPLRKIYPEAKIIHIVRDGRDYVRSGMGRDWYTSTDKRPRLKAKFLPEDSFFDKWEKMSRFEKICWRWQKKDNFIYSNLKNDNNYIRVKFEDIFKNRNKKGLYKIIKFVGLEKSKVEPLIDKMLNKKINSSTNYKIPKWSHWSEKKKKIFDNIAGEHMEKYYDYNW